MSEFPDKAVARDLGDPAQDPPCTWRVERWEDRMRTDVRRAVKTDVPWIAQWVVVGGGVQAVGEWLTDDQVASWPVCPHVITEAAYHLAAGRAPNEGAVKPLHGDMGEEAFRG